MQLIRHDEAGLMPQHSHDALLHNILRYLRVERTDDIVQHIHVSVRVHSTRERDAGLLATREVETFLSDLCEVTFASTEILAVMALLYHQLVLSCCCFCSWCCYYHYDKDYYHLMMMIVIVITLTITCIHTSPPGPSVAHSIQWLARSVPC